MKIWTSWGSRRSPRYSSESASWKLCFSATKRHVPKSLPCPTTTKIRSLASFSEPHRDAILTIYKGRGNQMDGLRGCNYFSWFCGKAMAGFRKLLVSLKQSCHKVQSPQLGLSMDLSQLQLTRVNARLRDCRLIAIGLANVC